MFTKVIAASRSWSGIFNPMEDVPAVVLTSYHYLATPFSPFRIIDTFGASIDAVKACVVTGALRYS